MSGESHLAAGDDVTDGGLIDVQSLGDLLDEPDESSLARALERILASSKQNAEQNGFSNSI
jgi:hypothetical protein